MKRRSLRLWDILHEIENGPDRLWARNFLVFRGERPKVAELTLQDLQAVFLMIVRDSAGPEQVEVAAVYETYQLRSLFRYQHSAAVF